MYLYERWVQIAGIWVSVYELRPRTNAWQNIRVTLNHLIRRRNTIPYPPSDKYFNPYKSGKCFIPVANLKLMKTFMICGFEFCPYKEMEEGIILLFLDIIPIFRSNMSSYAFKEFMKLPGRLMQHYGDWDESKGLRRIDLTIMTLVPITKMHCGYVYKEFVQCHDLLFEIIPQPFVTVRELKEFLRLICTNPNDRGLIKYYCELYKELFPNSTKLYQPRSLKHLSRCKVCECLRHSSTRRLAAVWDLDIADSLKRYILVDYIH